MHGDGDDERQTTENITDDFNQMTHKKRNSLAVSIVHGQYMEVSDNSYLTHANSTSSCQRCTVTWIIQSTFHAVTITSELQ